MWWCLFIDPLSDEPVISQNVKFPSKNKGVSSYKIFTCESLSRGESVWNVTIGEFLSFATPSPLLASSRQNFLAGYYKSSQQRAYALFQLLLQEHFCPGEKRPELAFCKKQRPYDWCIGMKRAVETNSGTTQMNYYGTMTVIAKHQFELHI